MYAGIHYTFSIFTQTRIPFLGNYSIHNRQGPHVIYGGPIILRRHTQKPISKVMLAFVKLMISTITSTLFR